MTYDEIYNKLKENCEAIWMEKPADVTRTRNRKGPRGQNFTIISYTESETRALVDSLYNMRVTANQENVDVLTLAKTTANLINFLGSRYTRYYNMVDTPQLFKETAEVLEKEVKTKEQFIKLLEPLTSYVGKLNYWYDYEIPWDELGDEFSKLKGDA
jgi:galactokinase